MMSWTRLSCSTTGHRDVLDRHQFGDDVADFLGRRLVIELGQLRQVDGVEQGVEDRCLGGVVVIGLFAHDLGDRLRLVHLLKPWASLALAAGTPGLSPAAATRFSWLSSGRATRRCPCSGRWSWRRGSAVGWRCRMRPAPPAGQRRPRGLRACSAPGRVPPRRGRHPGSPGRTCFQFGTRPSRAPPCAGLAVAVAAAWGRRRLSPSVGRLPNT